MISNLKVSDGDLVFINIGDNTVPQYIIEQVKSKLQLWAKNKGLSNTEFFVSAGMDITVHKVTVNDVFEEEVLKGNSDE